MCLRATRRHQTFRWSFEITLKKLTSPKVFTPTEIEIKSNEWASPLDIFALFSFLLELGKITLPIISFTWFPCSLMKHAAVSVVNEVLFHAVRWYILIPSNFVVWKFVLLILAENSHLFSLKWKAFQAHKIVSLFYNLKENTIIVAMAPPTAWIPIKKLKLESNVIIWFFLPAFLLL